MQRPAPLHVDAQGTDGRIPPGKRCSTVAFMGVGIHNPGRAYAVFSLQPAQTNNHVVKYTESSAKIPLSMVVSAAQKEGKTCLPGAVIIIFQRGKAASIGSPRIDERLHDKVF